jgi:hypothetical protein
MIMRESKNIGIKNLLIMPIHRLRLGVREYLN